MYISYTTQTAVVQTFTMTRETSKNRLSSCTACKLAHDCLGIGFLKLSVAGPAGVVGRGGRSALV